MVWIHGGSFVSGSGSDSLYDGTSLAAQNDVIVVSINYRLGNFGFLAIPGEIAGNFGMHDQQLALAWVRRYISYFGGNPKKVTIFGESAGATSVGFHLFSIPRSRYLFRAAIMESNPIGVPLISTDGEMTAQWKFFQTSICKVTEQPSTCNITLSQLRNYSASTLVLADELFQSKTRVSNGWSEWTPWSPVVDGKFVIDQPFNGYAKGMPAKPFVFGFNRNESVLFVLTEIASFSSVPVADQSALFSAVLNTLFGTGSYAAIETITLYNPKEAPPSLTWGGNIPLAAFNNLLNDMVFRCALLNTMQRTVKKNKDAGMHIFGYAFVQYPDEGYVFPGELSVCESPTNNVCHGAELPFVFNTLSQSYPNVTVPNNDQILANHVGLLWGTFAKTLSITQFKVAPFTEQNVYEIGDGSIEPNVYNYSNCAFWKTQYPYNTQ